MMKKADFLAMVANLKNPKIKSNSGSVYLYDDKQSYEIYRACNMKEAGIISAMNQAAKYRGWMQK